MKEENEIRFQTRKPEESISDFVESFWLLEDLANTEREIVVIPDGRVDIFLSRSEASPFQIVLMGLEDKPGKRTLHTKHLIFAISLKLLAIEYLLDDSIRDLLNTSRSLAIDFWGFSENDLSDFDSFCIKATEKIKERISSRIDPRKRKLFELIYLSNGTYTVSELSKSVYWNSRQINRYFTKAFGLPLKAYCNILRFKASLAEINEGNLFPELNFADQAHFIKEVKKLSGVIPKELSKNENDRFIQLSAWRKK